MAFDDTFFDRLAKMVNEEPVMTRDLVAMGQLRSQGLEKGKAFNPDSATRTTLKQAAEEAHETLMLASLAGEAWWPGTQWRLPEHTAPRPASPFRLPTHCASMSEHQGVIMIVAIDARNARSRLGNSADGDAHVNMRRCPLKMDT